FVCLVGDLVCGILNGGLGFADPSLHLALCLLGQAFDLHLLVAEGLAGALLGFAASLICEAFDLVCRAAHSPTSEAQSSSFTNRRTRCTSWRSIQLTVNIERLL